MSTRTRSGLIKPGYDDFADINVINENYEKIEDLLDEKVGRTEYSSPFNFKGSTTYAALPATGNVINDTYFCTDKDCRYTWNGSAWAQSSLDEGKYVDRLNALTNRLDALGLYIDEDGDMCQED